MSQVSYPDPNVRNDDHVCDDHRYVHLGLGTRLICPRAQG